MSAPLPSDGPTPVDYMGAAAEILTAVAWPLAVVGLVLLLRKPIVSALQGLVEFKWGSAAFRFERTIGVVAESLAESHAPQPTAVEGDAPTISDTLADTDPRSAVIRGYVAIEDWAARNFPAHGIEAQRNHRSRPLTEMVREAVEKKKLPATMLTQVQGLQTMRKLAAHSPTEPTAEQASEFLSLADAVLHLLKTQLK